jgi:transcription antitermination factor NusG
LQVNPNGVERAEAYPLSLETQNHQWYAIRVRSNFERSVTATLRYKQLEVFHPTISRQVRWSDRVKQTEFPVFPGYVVCYLDIAKRLPVLVTPGVVGVVGYGKEPAPLDMQEIENIRMLVWSGAPFESYPYLNVGDAVLVERGPLAGAEGILIRKRSECRLVLSVSLLQRSVAVEIDRDWVRPISRAAAGSC